MMEGLFTALVTPFDAHDQLDLAGFRANIRDQIDAQVDGIVVLGTTGESPTLSDEERETVITVAVEEAKGRIPVIVGTGCNSTKTTIQQTQEAEKLGADRVLVVAPYYNKPTQEGIYQHYEAVADSTSLPIIVYNHPGRTGINIQIATLKRLAEIKSIVAVKDCSEQVSHLMDLIEAMREHRPDFKILTGIDSFAYLTIALGGHGAIAVASNLLPVTMKNLVHSALEGDLIQAQQLHYQLSPFFKATNLEINPTPIKHAMHFCGKAAGNPRLPLCGLQPENASLLEEATKALYECEAFGVLRPMSST